VLVWLSQQTMVMPGWVHPSSGLMMCTMAASRIAHAKKLDTEFSGVCSSCRTCRAAASTLIGKTKHLSVWVGVDGPWSPACDRGGAPQAARDLSS